MKQLWCSSGNLGKNFDFGYKVKVVCNIKRIILMKIQGHAFPGLFPGFQNFLSEMCVHGTQTAPKCMENHNPFLDLQKMHWG